MMATTDLLKRSNLFTNVPVDIRTLPEEVAFGLDELIMFMGQKVFVILYDTGHDITATACKKLYDLPFYASVDDRLPKHIEEDSSMLLSVTLLNPADLPYRLEGLEEAFMIYDEWESNRFDSMEEVASKVEETFETYNESDIDDFIIMSGVEMSAGPKLALIRRIETWRELNKEASHGRNIFYS